MRDIRHLLVRVEPPVPARPQDVDTPVRPDPDHRDHRKRAELRAAPVDPRHDEAVARRVPLDLLLQPLGRRQDALALDMLHREEPLPDRPRDAEVLLDERRQDAVQQLVQELVPVVLVVDDERADDLRDVIAPERLHPVRIGRDPLSDGHVEPLPAVQAVHAVALDHAEYVPVHVRNVIVPASLALHDPLAHRALLPFRLDQVLDYLCGSRIP